jgi:DHA3 family macrolide efflux protein-like MFS transporter
MMPIGLLVAGPVADRYGVQVWFLVGGAITILAGVAGFVIPALRDIELQPATASSSGEEAHLDDPKTGLVAQPVPMEISSSD